MITNLSKLILLKNRRLLNTKYEVIIHFFAYVSNHFENKLQIIYWLVDFDGEGDFIDYIFISFKMKVIY